VVEQNVADPRDPTIPGHMCSWPKILIGYTINKQYQTPIAAELSTDIVG
jgi:hypothetical protein